MKQRSKVMTGTAIGASVAAIWVGMLVTSSAIASEPPTDKVALSVISASSTGDAFLCEFEDVAVVPMSPEEWARAIRVDVGSQVPGVISGSGVISGTIDAGEVPDATMGTVVVSGAATAVTGEVLVPLDGLEELPVLADGTLFLGAEQPRMGTAEECATVRPVSIPGFSGIEMGETILP